VNKTMLEQLLKEHCSIKPEIFERARKLHRENGVDTGRLLVRLGAITEIQLIEALAAGLNLTVYQNEEIQDNELLPLLEEKLDINFLFSHQIFPLKADRARGILYAVTDDPFQHSIFDYVMDKTGWKIAPVLAPDGTVKELIRGYRGDTGRDFVSLDGEQDTAKLKEMAFEAPVVQFLNHLLGRAVELRASDIHIESSEHRYRVRLRIDGILHEKDVLEEQFYLAAVSRVKLLAGLDIAEKRLPQDGKFSTRIASHLLDIRVSTIPTVSGEGVVLRLLYREKLSFDLENLGMEADHRRMITEVIKRPHGMLLVTGPTGSGKTTTLYSMLTRLNSEERKIITTEDPVEYQLQGINQIQVKSEIGLTFAGALRSILRHDPDVIMVGEIRDKETAEISIQSALTGHFVLSTLHTNDAASSLFRLTEMGVEGYLINAAVTGLIAQRIARRNCPFCSRPDEPPEYLLEQYAIHNIRKRFADLIPDGPAYMKGEGCPQCAGTGYRGRTAIFELFDYTDDLREVFLKTMSLEALRQAVLARPGFRHLREDGMIKVMKGLTTIEEVLRVC
jgi:type II secretory ATPase GspE/PulE/Tfp pilus assembly ATPase PilB-like protein